MQSLDSKGILLLFFLSVTNHISYSVSITSRSHDTHPLLPPPTPSSFTLDFRQLLQAIAADPTSPPLRARPRKADASRRNRDYIVEEEDGWEVVDEPS